MAMRTVSAKRPEFKDILAQLNNGLCEHENDYTFCYFLGYAHNMFIEINDTFEEKVAQLLRVVTGKGTYRLGFIVQLTRANQLLVDDEMVNIIADYEKERGELLEKIKTSCDLTSVLNELYDTGNYLCPGHVNTILRRDPAYQYADQHDMRSLKVLHRNQYRDTKQTRPNLFKQFTCNGEVVLMNVE